MSTTVGLRELQDYREAVSTVRLVVDSLAPVRRDWESLLAEIPHPSPYWDWNYVRCWWETFGRRCPERGCEGRLWTAVVRHHGEIVGIFPMFAERRAPWSLLERRLRFLGYNGGAGPNDMTEEPIYLVKPGFEEAALEGLKAAVEELRPHYDLLDLRLWSRGEPSRAFRGRVKNGPAVVELPEDWAQFRTVLSKSMRDNLGYYPRLLVRHGHTFQVRVIQGEEIARATETLVDLHKRRLAASNDLRRTDHFPTQLQADFQAQALSLAENGFIAILEVDGIAIAAQSFMEAQDTLLIGYSGFDPEWSNYSPLLVLQSEVFQGAMGRGVRRLDFQQGHRHWQTRWLAKPDGHIFTVTSIRKAPVSLARAALYFGRREIVRGLSEKRLRRLWAKVVEKGAATLGLDLPRVVLNLERLHHLGVHHVVLRAARIH